MTAVLVVGGLWLLVSTALVAFLSHCCRQGEEDLVSLRQQLFEAQALKKRYEFERNRAVDAGHKTHQDKFLKDFKDKFLTDRDMGDELPTLGPPAFPENYCRRCGESCSEVSPFGEQCKLTPPPGWEVICSNGLDPSFLKAHLNAGRPIAHRPHSDVLFIPHPEDLLT
jgi:hypothetical protein